MIVRVSCGCITRFVDGCLDVARNRQERNNRNLAFDLHCGDPDSNATKMWHNERRRQHAREEERVDGYRRAAEVARAYPTVTEALAAIREEADRLQDEADRILHAATQARVRAEEDVLDDAVRRDKGVVGLLRDPVLGVLVPRMRHGALPPVCGPHTARLQAQEREALARVTEAKEASWHVEGRSVGLREAAAHFAFYERSCKCTVTVVREPYSENIE